MVCFCLRHVLARCGRTKNAPLFCLPFLCVRILFLLLALPADCACRKGLMSAASGGSTGAVAAAGDRCRSMTKAAAANPAEKVSSARARYESSGVGRSLSGRSWGTCSVCTSPSVRIALQDLLSSRTFLGTRAFSIGAAFVVLPCESAAASSPTWSAVFLFSGPSAAADSRSLGAHAFSLAERTGAIDYPARVSLPTALGCTLS